MGRAVKKGIVARYLRLSDDDPEAGESIEAQRAVVDACLDGLPELSGLPRVDYVDRGVTGTHFRRPAFQRLTADLRRGAVVCVAVKDLSRLGRDYLAVGDWVEQIFPFFGVRFLSASDGLDSERGQGGAGALENALKALMHQSYSADLSRKIASAKQTRARLGALVPAFVPYGYRKEGRTVVIDGETGPVVRWLFARRGEGCGLAALARRLNRAGVPSPMAVRQARGEGLCCRALSQGPPLWTAGTVARILGDGRYTGAGRYRTKEGTVLETPGGFPPLTEAARTGQGARRERRAALAGRVRCGVCGYGVPARIRGTGIEYRCRRHWTTGGPPCPTGRWPEGKLLALVERVWALLAGGRVRVRREADNAARYLCYARRGKALPPPAPETLPPAPCTLVLEEGGRLTLRFALQNPFCL